MKAKEELNALKEEVETLNKKLTELTEDELNEVTGGSDQTSLAEVAQLLDEAQTMIDSMYFSSGSHDISNLKYAVKQARSALSQGDIIHLLSQLQYILKQINTLNLYSLQRFSELISKALDLLG